MTLVVTMCASVAVGISLAYASWQVLGPPLAGRSGLLQAAVGAVCGAAAAAPSLLLLTSRRRRSALVPVLCWLLAAAFLFLWAVPFRDADSTGNEDFFPQAGWYVPSSVVVYLGAVIAVLRHLPADAARRIQLWLEGDPPADRRTRTGAA